MTVETVLALAAVAVAIAALLAVLMAGQKGRADQMARLAQLAEVAERLSGAQTTLAGRMQQAQSDTNQRLDSLSKRLGDGLTEQTTRTGETLKVLHERLAVIDSAQKNITDLSQQMVSLQDILSNKQARGAFGEIQLNDLVSAALPASAFEFQATLSNGKRADCMLKLPNPPGSIVIDSKFPLESYSQLRNAETDADKVLASRAFSAAVITHIKAIAERYIVAGETAESALMFLPSEAVYAELHANFRNVVEEGFRRRVWIVSPTTLMATLNTVRAILRDVHMREQADVIQTEVGKMLEDVGRLDDRVGKLETHFDQAHRDIREIRISTDKVVKRGATIDGLQLGAGEEAPKVLPSSES
ncbi:MAG: DNA recombination protein RmuC [Proteobacteria bacterium]|nr:DNA recombination protein RmuC [Pseudomonadota bacterium]